MAHLWVRAETRDNERRVGITPDGVAAMKAAGHFVTVEEAPHRVIPIGQYAAAGAAIMPAGSWRTAPKDALIFGLKELPDTEPDALGHRHIMFGHAFKEQAAGKRLLARFKVGEGVLYDLEYLTDDTGRRVAAFGYWAGFAGAAVSTIAWAAQSGGGICPAVGMFDHADDMAAHVRATLDGRTLSVLVIGALGRVGQGACALCSAVGLTVTRWDMAETAHGGPFPELFDHDMVLNCILARPGTPVFVPKDALTQPRRLSVIGDIACDPDSDYNPIPVYSQATGWDRPVTRVHDAPPLDVMAIDNLPSLLPEDSSVDFARQLLPHLMTMDRIDDGVWARARGSFDAAITA